MRLFLVIGGLVLAALVVPFVLPGAGRPVPTADLPWQIEILPEGRSRIFGLSLPGSTLHDARARFGPDLEIALIVAKEAPPALEAYIPGAQMGYVTGKLIFTVEAPAEALPGLIERTVKREPMKSGAFKHLLAAADKALVSGWPIKAVALIPSVDLDEATLVERFGSPAERVATEDGVAHLLYPERGLDIVLSREGKELFQYVAPAAFAALRAPLFAAGGSAPDQ